MRLGAEVVTTNMVIAVYAGYVVVVVLAAVGLVAHFKLLDKDDEC